MILLAVLILAATSIDLLVLLTLSLSFFVQFCSAQSDVVLKDTGTLLQTGGMIEWSIRGFVSGINQWTSPF